MCFFHNSLQPLPRPHCCKRPSKLSTQSECTVVYSHSHWLVNFCTSNSSRALARERWQTFENSWKETQLLMNTLYVRTKYAYTYKVMNAATVKYGSISTSHPFPLTSSLILSLMLHGYTNNTIIGIISIAIIPLLLNKRKLTFAMSEENFQISFPSMNSVLFHFLAPSFSILS